VCDHSHLPVALTLPQPPTDYIMLRTAALSAKSLRFAASKARLHTLNGKRLQAAPNSNSYVPIATISACAITSATMYYYFMNKTTIKNDDGKSEEQTEAVSEFEEEPKKEPKEITNEIVEIVEASAPAEVIEVVDVVIGNDEDAPNPMPLSTPAGEETLEQEAHQQGAFNEETGEINWDCPCLGGMANGPCGEDFKASFSCFVYSKEEPKGIECIQKFKDMQDCFRRYPEIYSEELRDEEALEQEVVQTEKAVEQAVMNNDIIESVEGAILEAKEIKDNAKKTAIDLYGAAQKKIDDFHKK
jgi:mitochondrial intermembrane space import and assembly protein 40